MTARLAVTFPQDDLVRLTVSFTRRPTDEEIAAGTAKDVDDWQPVDPTTVDAWVRPPDDAQTMHSYLDSPADIERDDVGNFHLDVVADQAGTWYFGFVSTGTGQAAAEHKFVVNETMRLP